ncbi:16S rRNA (uracil(1498)-N(3))-methyltransferase [Cohnella sp. CFH 77786]|uniref:16S rRNA (uracil(1498)-N(3))-methyltransferase n=1 Tax=Cohnella sp. CFH 77786 TaxID=2662265 RepID=UPI001C60E67E|nr:16S rRNA (uracil(1498)-N(3))-methyltransferase [Cohnella sp. CFH 77786]MBW5444911.1 16S rRNA (uracil(1498)-N(3))-methyltransferase [Cohnella sp. CFH 77786]
MQRYFVDPARMSETAVTLTGEDARHLGSVMRAKPGDTFIACDGRGRDALAQIRSIDRDAIVADIIRELPIAAEMAWRVTVAQSLPKGDKLETVIQKGTEAGAYAFQPFLSRRTVVQYDERKEAKRLDRWRKIAKEAAEQSHRSRVPDVRPVTAWGSLIRQFADYDLVLLCYEEEGRAGSGLRRTLSEFRGRLAAESPAVLLLVGPEGGFAPEEAEEAAAAGALPVGLGKRILRTETAALYALACIGYESGELGGEFDA